MPDAAQYTLGLFDTSALGRSITAPVADAEPAEDTHEAPADITPAPDAPDPGVNYTLNGDRRLARGWPARARDNIAAIALSKRIEEEGRAATQEEQERLLRFVGFGATELAQNAFPLPGDDGFRRGWEEIGQSLADATTSAELAALCRATQL